MLDLDLGPLFVGRRREIRPRTVEVLTVCTGNVARSPLAAQLLRLRLAPLDVRVASAGTRPLVAEPMAPEAVRLAASLGIPAADSAAHRARWLSEEHVSGSDLVLAMTREHRTHVVELAPARVRAAFTVREFARLARDLPDTDVRATADTAGAEPHLRVRAVLALLAERRGELGPPAEPADDDVIDPYRRSRQTYELAAAQLVPAVGEVARVLRAILS